MKEIKKQYRDYFSELKEVKGEVFFLQQGINTTKEKLVASFEEWYANTFDMEDGTDDYTLGEQFFESGRFGGEMDTLRTNKEQEEVEGVHQDPDAMAFIRAKKKVDDLNRAKKVR